MGSNPIVSATTNPLKSLGHDSRKNVHLSQVRSNLATSIISPLFVTPDMRSV